MDAKKEAEELVNSFMEVNREQRYQDDLNIFEAKQCALISIRITIKALEHNQWQNKTIIDHYKEVEQEITKL